LAEAASALLELFALDLTGLPASRGLWAATGDGDATDTAALPPEGFASPMGFWFYRGHAAGLSADASRRITISEKPITGGMEEPSARPSGRLGRARRCVTWKALHTKDGEVSLTIGPMRAQVVAGHAAWEAIAEPVLLVIGQWWRFEAVDEALERLLQQARGDHLHASMPSRRAWWMQRRLTETDRQIRDLVQDVAQFAGPLWDPTRYCTSPRGAETYRMLADELDLEGWSARIDEMLEIVTQTYETIVEKILHYKLFVWGIVLEVLILVLISITLLR
jgi:hypothetical protein